MPSLVGWYCAASAPCTRIPAQEEQSLSGLCESDHEGDAILQPLPLGAPYNALPHAVIVPDASSAAKACEVE